MSATCLVPRIAALAADAYGRVTGRPASGNTTITVRPAKD